MNFIKFFVVFLAFFISVEAGAQYKFGIQGGVGISNYVGKDFSSKNDPKMGITAGIFFEREINLTLSVGAELNYDQKGTFYEFFPREATIVYVDSRLNYISVPIIMKAYFGQKANYYIYTGLTPSYLKSHTLSHSATEYGYSIASEPFFPYTINNWDAAVTVGFGLNFYEIILDIRYHHGIVNIYEGHNVPSIRNQFLSATLGFSIYKKKVVKCFNY